MTTGLEQTLQDGTSQVIEMSVNAASKDKKAEIEEACDAVDVGQLVRLADSAGGLLEDELRRRAWPILLGYSSSRSDETAPDASWKRLPAHRDEYQVRLDVDRAFVYYPKTDSDQARSARKEQLFDLIVSVLRQHSALCYTQGFHDIAQVLLLVLGQDEAPAALTHLSLLRIRDYMLPDLTPALKHLQLIPAIFKQADPALATLLSHTDPYYAISATITLYAHDIQDYADVARLFDFVLAHEPVMSLYLFAAMVISRRKELLEIDDLEMLNYLLPKLPQPLDLQAYINRALRLFDMHPPEQLPGLVWWMLPASSVLKTSRLLTGMQSLEDAEATLDLQARQLEREKRRKTLQKKASLLLRKNRKPIISITAAVLVGCVAIWMRRTGNDQMVMSLLATLTRSSWKR